MKESRKKRRDWELKQANVSRQGHNFYRNQFINHAEKIKAHLRFSGSDMWIEDIHYRINCRNPQGYPWGTKRSRAHDDFYAYEREHERQLQEEFYGYFYLHLR